MGKKIRFPLELAEGAQARSIEELREHFDLDAVLGYYKNGRLLTWLRDRYMEAEAEAVETLDEHTSDFQGRLCGILGVEHSGDEADLEAIERRQRRLERLRAITGENEYLDHIDQVAFDQEELADPLDENAEKIYLCSDQLFTVPASRKNVEYVGIHQPKVHISGSIEGVAALRLTGCNVENAPSVETNAGKLDDLICDELVECSAAAVVSRVQLDTGERGFRTVQVYFEHPVYLDGVEYDHVPVLSYELFKDMGLCKGSEVRVHRVGDVIPSITLIKRGNGKPIEVDARCTCGSYLTIKNKKLYCDNPGCQSNIVGRLTGFIEALGVDGYSEMFIKQLVESSKSTNENYSGAPIVDISSLLKNTTEAKLAEMKLETKSALAFHDILVDAIAKTPDYIILGAMGIQSVGPARAALIIKDAGGFKNLCNWDECSPRIGKKGDPKFTNVFSRNGPPKLCLEVANFTNSQAFIYDLIEVYKHMRIFTDTSIETIRVGHTGGNLSMEVKAACVANSFQIVDGKTFDMLIVPNHSHQSTRAEKAEKDNVPVFTEHEFRAKYDWSYTRRFESVDED